MFERGKRVCIGAIALGLCTAVGGGHAIASGGPEVASVKTTDLGDGLVAEHTAYVNGDSEFSVYNPGSMETWAAFKYTDKGDKFWAADTKCDGKAAYLYLYDRKSGLGDESAYTSACGTDEGFTHNIMKKYGKYGIRYCIAVKRVCVKNWTFRLKIEE